MTVFGGARSIAIGLSVNPRGVFTGLAVAEKRLSDFARAGAQASQKHKRAYDQVARGLGATGLALGAFAAVSVTAFARFDKAISRAQAGTRATASEMTALRKAALEAGAQTQYSATQAADAITEMGKAGISTQDILGGGLKGTLALAAAGELDVARAAEIAATTMNQFGLSGQNVTHVADVLAAGAGKAQGSVEDLAQGLKYVGPIASGMGISLEQTVGVLAEFASKGILGEQAGTSFRGMLLSLTSPSKKASEEMASLGINLYDAQGQFIGMDRVAGQLQSALGGLTESQRNAALGIIFGNEQVTAARILYEGGADAVREWQAGVDDQNYSLKQAALLTDNLVGDLERLKGALETAFINSGSGANEGLRSIVQAGESAVNMFNALPAPVQKSAVIVAGVGGAGLIATAGLLKLVGAAAEARTNLAALGVTANATKTALIGIGKAGAAIAIITGLGYAASKIREAVGGGAVDVAKLGEALDELSAKGKTDQSVGTFGKNFDDLGERLRTLSDPGLRRRFDDVRDSVLNVATFGLAPGGVTTGSANRSDLLDDLKSLDTELTQLVQSGHAEDARKLFSILDEKSNGRLGIHLPEYTEALGQVDEKQKAAAGSATAFGQPIREDTVLTAALTKAHTDLVAALDASTNAFLKGRGASRDYQAALDAAEESVKTNGKTLDENSEKGRANAVALDQVATSSLAYLATLTGPKGEVTPAFTAKLEGMRKKLVETYLRFNNNKAAANRFADAILAVPTKRSTEVQLLGAEAAIAKLRELIRLAQHSNIVVRSPGITTLPRLLTPNPEARRAGGGIIPGAPSSRDNRIAAVATGEFVVNAAQTSKHRGLLEKINAGTLKAFATGGFNSPYGASDVFSRYQGLLPKPITPEQYAAAMKARSTADERTDRAAISQRNAERDLAKIRRTSPKDAEKIRDAEDRLNKARISYAAARRNEAQAEVRARDAVRRRNAPKGFNLGLYLNALGGTVKQAESYRRNLGVVSKRGGSDLAAALEAMGADGAPLIAALVKASPAQFKRLASLLKRLDPSAFGGGTSVTKFAAGGIAPASLGGWRVMAEAGQDEAFIPLGATSRNRSRALTGEVASRLGGQVQWSSHRVLPGSTGVSAAPSATATSSGGVSMNVGTVQLIRGGPEDVARDVMFAVRQLGG